VKQGLHQRKQSCSSVTHEFSFQPIIYSVCTNSLGTISAGKFIWLRRHTSFTPLL